jgi:hypothetical protein
VFLITSPEGTTECEISVVPSGLKKINRIVPSHEWLGYYQLSLTGQMAIVGDDERARGEIAIKDMRSGEQRSVKSDALVNELETLGLRTGCGSESQRSWR